MKYNKVLSDLIEDEKKGEDYDYLPVDKEILEKIFFEINCVCNTNIKFIAELDEYLIDGAGDVIAKYINNLSSESTKAFLLPQIINDRTKDCDILVLNLYKQFRLSNDYSFVDKKHTNSHITVRYDNAFLQLKSKRIAKELIPILINPMDAYYLPLTMRKIASWKIEDLKNVLNEYVSLLKNYYKGDFSTSICRTIDVRELTFTVIACLKHYPTFENKSFLESLNCIEDNDLRIATRKVLKHYEKLRLD